MIRSTLAAAALACVLLSASAASAMTVQTFLTTAAGVPRNPTALLRPDARRLLRAVQDGFKAVKAENDAARAAGRRPASCPPQRISISPNMVLNRFNAIPAARRNITVTQAIREWMAAQHPCPAA